MDKINSLFFNFLKELKSIKKYNDSNFYKIYGISDPTTNELFYIGCTKVKIATRIYCHYKEKSVWDGSDLESKNKRIKLLVNNGILPNVEVFYYIKDKNTALSVEKCLIHFLINNTNKINLLNKANSFQINYDKLKK